MCRLLVEATANRCYSVLVRSLVVLLSCGASLRGQINVIFAPPAAPSGVLFD